MVQTNAPTIQSNTGNELIKNKNFVTSNNLGNENSNTINSPQATTHMLGIHPIADLRQAPFADWFLTNYQAYQPDSLLIPKIKELLKGKTLQIFLGTWCGDSKREVPRMLKILAAAGFDSTKLQLVFVNNTPEAYKKSPGHEEQGKNIVRVPTLIVYKGKTEIGRFIEYPKESIEKDLLKILQGEPYEPNYFGKTVQ
ncbi:MAG: thiol reductase thioredoxin [Chitinophagaceae bacterium BSSC1]|nr:MAG: thiol reductase thioredoxin [Chitinophagaceae bacterium BSSC1]